MQHPSLAAAAVVVEGETKPEGDILCDQEEEVVVEVEVEVVEVEEEMAAGTMVAIHLHTIPVVENTGQVEAQKWHGQSLQRALRGSKLALRLPQVMTVHVRAHEGAVQAVL